VENSESAKPKPKSWQPGSVKAQFGSTIITGGDASMKPEHLSFLTIWRHRQHHQGQPKKQ